MVLTKASVQTHIALLTPVFTSTLYVAGNGKASHLPTPVITWTSTTEPSGQAICGREWEGQSPSDTSDNLNFKQNGENHDNRLYLTGNGKASRSW